MSKNRYDAQINDKQITVDLFELPYDEFDENNPLIVQGPVVLTEQTRSTDLTNVRIIGDFDISKQKIAFKFPQYVQGAFICRSCSQVKSATDPKTKIDLFTNDFKFPERVTEIDCTHSIKNFDYFIGRIPSSVKTILVADSMITSIASDPEKMASAIKLNQLYPDIVVMGSKNKTTLSEELINIKKQQEESQKPKIIEKDIDIKTQTKPMYNPCGDYLTRKDIVSCLSLDEYISFFLSETELDRIVRQMLKNYDKKTVLTNKHDAEISCITFDDLQVFYDELFYAMVEAEAIIKEEMETAKNAKNNPEPEQIKQIESVKPIEKALPKPIDIKKYIPMKLWGDIQKICGNTLQTMEFVLNIISSVNMDINKTKQGNALQIIDTEAGSEISCSYLKKESGNCVVQSVDATISNDRKRIVWSYLPKEQILACIGVHSEHFCSTGQNKNSLEYKKNREFAAKSMDNNGNKLTLQRTQEEKYFDVDILKEIIKAKKLVKSIQIENNNTLTK